MNKLLAAITNADLTCVTVRDVQANRLRHILTGGNHDYWIVRLYKMMESSQYMNLMTGIDPEDLPGDMGMFDESGNTAELVRTPQRLAGFSGNNLVPKWPYNPTCSVSIVRGSASGTNVVTKVDGTTINTQPTSLSPDSKILSISWPTELGVHGALKWKADKVIALGATLEFNLPSFYPYEAVLDLITKDTGLFKVFEDADLVDAYYNESVPREKIAVACLALYRLFEIAQHTKK